MEGNLGWLDGHADTVRETEKPPMAKFAVAFQTQYSDLPKTHAHPGTLAPSMSLVCAASDPVDPT